MAPDDLSTFTAIVGGMVIDGNDRKPIKNATILIQGARIVAVGPRRQIKVPQDSRIIDAAGKYIIPGFVDTNVHLTLIAGKLLAKYSEAGQLEEGVTKVVIQSTQELLKRGVTTVRDTAGALQPLVSARDAINRGEVPGARLFVSGNIVGWGRGASEGGQRKPEGSASQLEQRINRVYTLGVGPEIRSMGEEGFRAAIYTYLDFGPDFIKYGADMHAEPRLTFAPWQHRALIEEVHKRGKLVEAHATTEEGLRTAIAAGVDSIQHTNLFFYSSPWFQGRDLAQRERTLPSGIVKEIVRKKILCQLTVTNPKGSAGASELVRRFLAVYGEIDEANRNGDFVRAARLERDLDRNKSFGGSLRALDLGNAALLLRAGCVSSIASDFIDSGSLSQAAGKPIPTITNIETLVAIGLTPQQAITVATKNGAIICRALRDFGTLENGKYADLLILDGDPLSDISNIRKINTVMKEGVVIDLDKLPLNPVATKDELAGR